MENKHTLDPSLFIRCQKEGKKQNPLSQILLIKW